MELTTSYKKSQIIEMYSKQDVSNSYVKAAAAFLTFCIEKDWIPNEGSRDIFVEGKAYTYKYMCNRFIKYFIELGSPNIQEDEASKFTMGSNAFISSFLTLTDHLVESSKVIYKSHLNGYDKWCQLNGMAFISYYSAINYRKHLKEQGKSASTINSMVCALHSMCVFLMKHRDRIEGMNANRQMIDELRDMRDVSCVNIKGQKIMQYLSREDRKVLLSSIDNLQDRLVISLMCNEGLRRGEINSLTAESFDFENNILKVKGKGYQNEEAHIRMFDTTCTLGLLMVELTDFGFSEYKPEYVSKLAKQYMKDAGVWQEGLTAHNLRHTAAQLLAEEGWSVEHIQLQLRHADMNTTKRYVNQSVYNQYLNRDKIKD